MNLSLLYDYDQFYSALHIEVDPWLDQRKVDCHCGYSKPAQELDLDSRIASFPHIPFLPVLSLFTVLHIGSHWRNPTLPESHVFMNAPLQSESRPGVVLPSQG